MKFHCSPAVLPVLADQLRGFGARVVFQSDLCGHVDLISGRLTFSHDGKILSVEIVEDLGHFPRRMLIGGMRQMIEEAVELCGAIS